jgi:Pre-toxin TG
MLSPVPEGLVDTTFTRWWAVFGSIPEAVARALARTKSQIGGAMPAAYVPPPWRGGQHAVQTGASQTAPASPGPAFLPVGRVDVTFNAWWKELGRTQEAIPAALARTKKQIGGPMPPSYVPPPLRPKPEPKPKPRDGSLLDLLIVAGPQASGIVPPLPEVIAAESPDGKSLMQLRARQKLLVDWLAAQTASSDAVSEVMVELTAVEAAIDQKLRQNPLDAAVDQVFHGPSPAASAGARAAAQALPLAQVLRLHIPEDRALRWVSDYLAYCERTPVLADFYQKALAEEASVREQIHAVSAAHDGIDKLGSVSPDRITEITRRLFGPAPANSLGARVAARFLPVASVLQLDLSPLEMERFLDEYLTYAHRYEMMAPALLGGHGIDLGREIAFYRQQEAEIETLRHALVPQKETVFELKEAQRSRSGWHAIHDPGTDAVLGYWRELDGVTKVVDRDGKVIALSEIPLEDPLQPVYDVARALAPAVIETAISFIPIVGEVVMACEAIAGQDLFGNKLSTGERALEGVGVVLPFLSKVPALLRAIPKAAKILESAKALEAFAKMAGRTIEEGRALLKGLAKLAPDLERLTEGYRAVRAGLKVPAEAQRAFARAASVLGALRPRALARGAGDLWGLRKFSTEQHVERFLEACDKMGWTHVKPELGSLTAKEFEAAFGKGPYPEALGRLAGIPGLGAFAKADPARATVLLEAAGQLTAPYVATFVGAHGLAVGADKLVPLIPEARAALGTSKVARGYGIIERASGVPGHLAPELHIRPSQVLDHNGAFSQGAYVPSLFGDVEWVPTKGRLERVLVQPDKILAGGVPFKTLDRLAVLGGHGSKLSISGMSPTKIAKMVADELSVASNGSNIEYLLLDACQQGDRRFIFFGETNAQAVQKALTKELGSRGMSDVTVLAAREAGPISGTKIYPQLPYWDATKNKLTRDPIEVIYVPAAQQPGRAYVNARLAAMLAGAGAIWVYVGVEMARRHAEEAAGPGAAPPPGQRAEPTSDAGPRP